MRIVIDLQGAQASNARRGIGRYSLSFAQAVARNAKGHEVLIALNAAFSETLEPLRAAFEGLLPAGAVRLWHSPLPRGQRPAFGMQRAAERVREAFLAALDPDMVHISSMFEGPTDGAVTSCGVFTPLPTSVALYDLIPLMRPETYLADPLARAHYLGKLEQIRRADLLLAISASSREEGLAHLGFTPDRCVNVATAADPHFVAARPPAPAEQALRARLALPRPFLMYTGGIDPRKNVEGLIRAFGMLPPALRDAHQLAIVCAAQPESRDALQRLSLQHGLADGQLVLTGFASEEDLVALYNLCEGFVFPSLHEGFGLPALEAMSCGAAVIASDCSSLPEVIGRQDALFNPSSDSDIAAAMQRLLSDTPWRESLRAHAAVQAQKFSWDATGARAVQAFEALHAARVPAAVAPPPRRPRMAFVSPLPPERSGIADYSAELLPELARHYDIDVIVSQPSVSDAWINGCCAVRGSDWFLQHAGSYDRVLYHFGNSAFHEYMFRLLRQVPGVVVLHDFFLSGIQSWREAHALAPRGWTHELMDGHGYAAVARRYLDTDTTRVVYDYPCSFGVIRDAAGVIVHSPHSQVLARQWYGEDSVRDWALIPLLRQPATPGRRAEARRKLYLPDDVFLVCSFGLLGPTKHNHRLVQAWCESALAARRDCRLVFVGDNHPSDYGRELQRTIAAAGSGRIEITGWASAEGFRTYLDAADVGVQLRSLSRGETSAAVLDCMNHGLAT
ncbi:MAG: glycosyltransferase, partial [Ramlibacter sp.]